MSDFTGEPDGATVPPGIGIGIFAPAGYAPDEQGLARALERLRRFGCRVKNYYDLNKKFQRFGGTDEERVAQLYAAMDDPDVDCLLALRGGYGISRLLHRIDFGRLARSGKPIIGHSDLTALQLPLLKAGACSFAGPMVCDDFTREDISEFTMAHFWRCVTQSSSAVAAAAAGNPSIHVSGLLWGGNLAMLTHLLGTPYMPQIEGGILFIEDINEHPYRVERMLLQLLHAGVLQQQRAIVLGDFSGYRTTPYDNGYEFEPMLAFIRSQLNLPVIAGLPFGHIRDKVTLAVGSRAELESDGTAFRLTMRDYPALHR